MLGSAAHRVEEASVGRSQEESILNHQLVHGPQREYRLTEQPRLPLLSVAMSQVEKSGPGMSSAPWLMPA